MLLCFAGSLRSQVTTSGFLNLPQPDAPGTLLSHPVTNGSEPIGRTTSINYLNGWIIVGAEAPGSRPGSDLEMRVYDISDPSTPILRRPSDFGLSYPGNRWYQGNYGWNAHGTAQHGNLLLPDPVRVNGFGGLVERAGNNGVPFITNLPLWYNRSSQAGPWDATLLWYDTDDTDIQIARLSVTGNFTQRRVLATFDHVGAYGGGDWHPMFFGDLLIMARSGGAARDGVVVYRLNYQNMDDADPANDSIIPETVGSLQGGFQGYWPNLFSDGSGLYVIGSTTDILMAADITAAADPAGEGSIQTVASLTIPGFTNASYPVYQDQFGFIHNRKVDMTRFIAGDANPITLTLNQANPPRPAGSPPLPSGALASVDTSQMSLPLGNLWLTGGYPIPGLNQGLGVWVHQQAPDTTAPRVSFHIPQAGRTAYPRHAPLSFLLHEHPRNGGPRNGIDFTVRPVGHNDSLGSAISGFLIHDFSGNLTFTPDSPLAADTTYQVDFHSDPATQTGFRDAAGNYIEAYSYRFSTGGGLQATPPPKILDVTADVYQPAPAQSFTITTSATGNGPLEYRFNFDGTWSAWSSTNQATHSYTTEGRPRVHAQVRDSQGRLTQSSIRLLVIDDLPPGPRPTQSSTLAVGNDPEGRRVWAVNPDSDTVTVIDALSGTKIAEHPVGTSPRGIARDANGRYWITCHGSDEIRILNPDGSLHLNLTLPYGSAPYGIASHAAGNLIYTTLQGSGVIRRYQVADPQAAPLIASGIPTPRAIAISADGSRVFVTRLISPDMQGEVHEFDASLQPVRTITLTSANTIDGGDRAAGVPNYLTGIALSPDGTRAAVVSSQANTLRGEFFGVGDLTHETTVRSVISFIDLTTGTEIPNSRRDFDNSDSPSAVIYSPRGDTLFITHQGNNRVAGMDALNLLPLTTPFTTGSMETQPAVFTLDLGTGLAPQGLLLDPLTQRLFTQNFTGRSITIRDASPFLSENRTSMPLVATTATVENELLPPDVLQGKRIFYNAADPRMSADSYISCASCHLDGGHDGRVWDFSGRGEGLRRTIDLRGRSGMGHGAVHWSGNFDEIQDFEHDIRGPFGGTGFLNLSPSQFATLHPHPGSGKSGLSPDLDALAAYVRSLSPAQVPRSPHRSPDGSLTAAALRGRAIFTALDCSSCHSGSNLTEDRLVDVGTQSAISGTRLGSALSGIDIPSLHGLHATRTYLHHGQAATLQEVFSYTGGTLIPATQGQLLGTGTGFGWDEPTQGGGGFTRGVFGGGSAYIGGVATSSGVRFSGINGGIGGTARISLRYVRQYSGGTAQLSINGVTQTLTVLRQFPDNSWQTSGWRWITVEAPLLAGNGNTIEVLRGNGDLILNSLLVSHAGDINTAQPHRSVLSLPSGDRDDLVAYLRQQDGRDDSGTPLPAPAAPLPQPPVILAGPQNITLAEGNTLHFTVAHSGTGPFSYAWHRTGVPVGENSPEFTLSSVTPADAGSYTCTVTNAYGSASTTAATVVVNGPLSILSTTLPAGTDGTPYSFDLSAVGGVSERTWTLVSGSLPPGLTLTPAGRIAGLPNAPARATIDVSVSDSSGSATRTFDLIITPVGGLPADPDLILHYTFDEGAGQQIWDSAPAGNNHSTNVQAAHWIADGRFGRAYGPSNPAAALQNFTPSNQADLEFHPRVDAFTISLWCRTTATSSYHTLFSKDGGDPYRVQFRLWNVNPANHLQGISGNQYGGQIATTSPALNDGQWHLVTMVNFNDNGTWRTRIYFNDGTTFSQFNTGSGGTVPSLLRIGGLSAGWNGWAGQIDDLRIYRRALTATEVSALYHAPTPQTYEDWSAQITNPALRPADADADADGLSNQLEFAFGPISSQPLEIEPNGSETRLTLTRNSLARGVNWMLEESPDLDTWSILAVSYNGSAPLSDTATVTENDGTIRQVEITIPAPETKTFYRLKVESP
jgi:YVTN family beta-propeller protein